MHCTILSSYNTIGTGNVGNIGYTFNGRQHCRQHCPANGNRAFKSTNTWSGVHTDVKLVPYSDIPDNNFHGANMGPTWVLPAPGWPHVGLMNLAIRDDQPRQRHRVWKIVFLFASLSTSAIMMTRMFVPNEVGVTYLSLIIASPTMNTNYTFSTCIRV